MVTTQQATESPKAPPAGTSAEAPFGVKVAVLVSVLIHLLGLVILGLSALLKPHRPSVVPVFELVNLEKPKLRPIEPKVQPPPKPVPPPPEPVRHPQAPKLTPKPTKPAPPKHAPPKVVKEEPDTTVPEKEVVHEQQVLENKVQTNVPTDPRLNFWARRVNKMVDNLWNPPTGYDVAGQAQTVVTFKVNRDGTIVDEAVTKGSGNSDLDEFAIMTIKRLGAVPPIPDNWPGDQLEVECVLKYQGT